MCDQQQYTTDSVFLNRLGFAPGVNGALSRPRGKPRDAGSQARGQRHRQATAGSTDRLGSSGWAQTPLPCARVLLGAGLPVPIGKLGTGAQHQLAALLGRVSRCWLVGSSGSLQNLSPAWKLRGRKFLRGMWLHPSSPESSREAPAPLPRKVWSMDAVPANCAHSTEPEQASAQPGRCRVLRGPCRPQGLGPAALRGTQTRAGGGAPSGEAVLLNLATGACGLVSGIGADEFRL